MGSDDKAGAAARAGRAWRNGVRGLAVLALAASLTACSPVYRYTGYAPTDDELSGLTPGRDTRETVAEAVGRPNAAGLSEEGTWYYVQSDWEHSGWRPPREIDREVVAISFDSRDVLRNVERFGLEDGQVVVLSRRVTDDQVQGISFARQLFRNLGRFAAPGGSDPLTTGGF